MFDKEHKEQLYCLIISQLLNDGFTAIGSTLLKSAKFVRCAQILPSPELFKLVFSNHDDTERKQVENEVFESSGNEEKCQNLSTIIDRSAKTEPKHLIKKVQMKHKFIYGKECTSSTSQDSECIPQHETKSDAKGFSVDQFSDTTLFDDIASSDSKSEKQNIVLDNPTAASEKCLFRKRKRCNLCNTPEEDLRTHILDHHANAVGGGFQCSICNKVILKKFYNFNEHLKTHSNSSHFICAECGEGFKRAAAYKNHKETAHSNRMFKCDECGKVFRCGTSLRAHRYIHTKTCNLPCCVCGRTFRYHRELVNHELTHTDLKPERCTVCERTFRTQSQLLRHSKHQHGSSQLYRCGLCDHTTVQRTNLKIHMKRHTGVKYGTIYTCVACLSVYPNVRLLDEHTSKGCKGRVASAKEQKNDF